MFFGRLRIRSRLYAGFASLVVLGLAIAAVGFWGIDGLGRQTLTVTRQSGNASYVASAIEGEDVIARILLGARTEPTDDMKPAFHQAQDTVRDALTRVKAQTLSTTRRDIYQGVLDKLDAQAQSADKSFDLGHTMLQARARLFAGGDALTAATTKLIGAVEEAQSPDANLAAAVVERSVLLVRVANWRFLVTKDPKGPATFAKNYATAMAAFETLEKLNIADAARLVQARAALVAYRDAFDATAAASLSLAEAYDTVQRPAVLAMQAELAKARDGLTRAIADAGLAAAELRDTAGEIQVIVGGVGLVVGVLLAFFIGRGIVRPVTGMTATMQALAAGNHNVTIPGADGHDEIADMARAVEVFRTSMIEANRLGAEQAAEQAARVRRQDAMDQHTKTFGTSVTGVMSALGNAAENMRTAADVMTEAAAAVHMEASETAGGAGKSSADLAGVAAAVEQFTASVGEIARQVAVASDVAAQAVQRAEASHATIRGLADSTARIGDVVRLIDSIAGQTNLLALNATIEAARAGDAGKGFAVVAGEVKALAAQTAKATAEIGAQIETVRGATEDTVAAMDEIGSIISRMGEVSTAISAAVEEQSVTTRDIAASIQAVSGSTAQAAQAMGHVVEVANRAGDASRNILSEANAIGVESERLRREVEKFLQAVNTEAGRSRAA